GASPPDRPRIVRTQMRIHQRKLEKAIARWRDRIALNGRRDAAVAFGRRADMIVSPKWPGDLACKELAESLSGDAAHQFAHEVAEIVAVIAASRAWLPPWRLRRERRRRLLDIADVAKRGRRRPSSDPGRVSEDMAHFDAFFSGRGEFRPVFLHRRVDIEFA